MRIRVLGSGAGGGFPQWNCSCHNCAAVRAHAPGFRARTQSSLAVSRDGDRWLLLNASPDLGEQIRSSPSLGARPDVGPRNSPIKAVVLTNADIDHVAGLLTLRESQAFSILANQRVLDVLSGNPVFNVLARDKVARVAMAMDEATAVKGAGEELGLVVQMFEVPGKVALYLEDASAGASLGTQPGDTVGLRIEDAESGNAFFYVPGCAQIDARLASRLRGATLVFFDGTLWSDDEMVRQGLLGKTGARMGHVNVSGESGSMAGFAGINVGRKVFIHINNSNPLLDETSPERAEAAGWEVAYDGMELSL